jgi:hypothetical protein
MSRKTSIEEHAHIRINRKAGPMSLEPESIPMDSSTQKHAHASTLLHPNKHAKAKILAISANIRNKHTRRPGRIHTTGQLQREKLVARRLNNDRPATIALPDARHVGPVGDGQHISTALHGGGGDGARGAVACELVVEADVERAASGGCCGDAGGEGLV